MKDHLIAKAVFTGGNITGNFVEFYKNKPPVFHSLYQTLQQALLTSGISIPAQEQRSFKTKKIFPGDELFCEAFKRFYLERFDPEFRQNLKWVDHEENPISS